jgi:hypothetical protein
MKQLKDKITGSKKTEEGEIHGITWRIRFGSTDVVSDGLDWLRS